MASQILGAIQVGNLQLTGIKINLVSATAGAIISAPATTVVDTSTAASGTLSQFNAHYLAAPTLSATNTAVTTTVANTLTISGAPIAGTNETLANSYALNVTAGATNLGGAVNVGGTLNVPGAITNVTSINGTSTIPSFSEYLAASTQNSCSANASVPYLFNTTPNSSSGSLGTWSSSGSVWSPGRAGVYMISWTTFGNNNGSQEFLVSKNVTPTTNGSSFASAKSSTAQLIYYNNNSTLNFQVTGVFYSASATDFVGFWQYCGNAITPTNNGNWVRFARIA